MPIAEAPQTNKMHAVPQNIMDVEFKLIGDLTLRQFMYLFIFGGAAYVCTVVLVGIFKWPAVLFFAIIGIGLAFVPIEERGLDEWIVNFIRSVYAPTQRIWRREPTLPSAFMNENLAVVKQELITLAPTSSRRKLEEYLEYQLTDSVQDPLDIPEREYMLKVRDAYKDVVPSSPAPASVGVGVLEPFEEPTYEQGSNEEPVQFAQPEPTTPEGSKPEETPSTQELTTSNQEQAVSQPSQPTTPAAQTSTTQQPQRPAPQPQQRQQQGQQQHKQKHQHNRQPQSSMMLSPLTPDRHSGRRFINLVPASGELVLPIRGERVLRTSEEMEVETDIQDKAEKLQQLLSQIKRDSGVMSSNTAARPVPQAEVPQAVSAAVTEQSNAVDAEAKSLAQKLQGEQERLSQEISKLETQKSTSTSQDEANQKDALIQRLKVEKERTQSDYESLQRQILDLQDKLKQKESSPQTASTGAVAAFQSPAAGSGKANTVTGSVRSKTGTTKEGVLLIIKNQKGEAVRAVKTDSLGHFKLSTPLSNGVYTIEVTGDDIGSTFDIITFEAKGEAIPSIEIFGK